MKLQEVLEKTTGFFREKGFPTARLDAEILLAQALKVERLRLYLDFDRPLSTEEIERCREVVRRRGQGEPVAYITGTKDFFGFAFQVSPAVLIPRPETEHLVEEALEWAKKNSIASPRVVDLGCGSGCVGLSFLKNQPEARLLAVDLSEAALQKAQENAATLGLADRCVFVKADAGDSSSVAMLLEKAGFAAVDLLLANPPYIDEKDARVEENVRRFEPSQALFAGDAGMGALKNWTRAWIPSLARTAFCMMEMGLDQGNQMRSEYEGLQSFESVSIVKDLSGHDRFVKGVRHG